MFENVVLWSLQFICCTFIRSYENVQHLFFDCPYMVKVWSWLLQAFHVPYVYNNDRINFFKYLLNVKMSPYLKDMWIAGLVAVLQGIWIQRNKCKFENVHPCFSRLCHGLSCWIKEVGMLSDGTMFNTVDDLLVLKTFGVHCHPRKAPKIVEVHQPPLPGWYKCNTDGLSKINDQAPCGGIFRNCRGFVCGVFVQSLGVETAFFTEFYAVVLLRSVQFGFVVLNLCHQFYFGTNYIDSNLYLWGFLMHLLYIYFMYLASHIYGTDMVHSDLIDNSYISCTYMCTQYICIYIVLGYKEEFTPFNKNNRCPSREINR